MISRLNKKDLMHPVVVKVLKVRENKAAILKSLGMYDPRNDYFHPRHPRHYSDSNSLRDQMNGFRGTVTGRMTGKTYMQQNILSQMLTFGTPKKVMGTSIRDIFLSDWATLEDIVQDKN
jgi:hypothetical protein